VGKGGDGGRLPSSFRLGPEYSALSARSGSRLPARCRRYDGREHAERPAGRFANTPATLEAARLAAYGMRTRRAPLHLSDRKDARSTDQPPAYADDRSAPSRHSPERRMTTAESLFSEAKSRHAASGIRRVHTNTVNSPPPHSTRARPSRFRPSSRHTGRLPPGSTHAARSDSSSWRSGTRSASGTRSCRPCRDPAR